ncbi:MAG: glycosyltransferase [Streptomycetaceae bacterium]|nr:glycosyltransferase [Streptomycetaceae bacterium]
MTAAAALVMAKAPRPGTVKTRLHPLLGPAGCAALQAALIAHTTALTCGEGLPTFLAVDPPDQIAATRRLVPPGVRLFAQDAGHLGQRLTAAVREVFARHGGPLVVVGTDAPTLAPGLLRAAVTVLAGGADVALGPALDGGYYLIGLRAPHTRVFELDPRLWSGDRVLAATLALAERAGLAVELLTPLRDLDTPADAAAFLGDPALPAEIADRLRPAEAPGC